MIKVGAKPFLAYLNLSQFSINVQFLVIYVFDCTCNINMLHCSTKYQSWVILKSWWANKCMSCVVAVMSPRPIITWLVLSYLLFFSDRCHSVSMRSTLIKHSPLDELTPDCPLSELPAHSTLHRSLLWCRLYCDMQMKIKSKQIVTDIFITAKVFFFMEISCHGFNKGQNYRLILIREKIVECAQSEKKKTFMSHWKQF